MRFEFNSSMDMWECGAMATTNCHRVLLSPVLATLVSELKIIGQAELSILNICHTKISK